MSDLIPRTIANIQLPDENAMRTARARQNPLTKLSATAKLLDEMATFGDAGVSGKSD